MTPILSIVNVLEMTIMTNLCRINGIILEIYDSLFKLIPEKEVELLFVDWGSRKPVLNSLQISEFFQTNFIYFYMPQKNQALIRKVSLLLRL